MVSTPVCANKERNGPFGANQGHSKPAKTAAMCTALRDYMCPLTSPIPPFLLANKTNFKLDCAKLISNSYIPPWGVVVLHIGVGRSPTPIARPHPREGYNYYITCYLDNITVEERYEQHS